MHKSSESIAAIAAALAKAQSALVNPEKTMTATIREEGRGQGRERSFRSAPLSAGLELVRNALGQHELAVVQTTSIDEAGRMVRLNTVLAHSSGEWISSDWPVCPISDINAPRRMGAALTYARRYGLFTLVGIAGEDDLDAPDLNAGAAGGARTGGAPSSYGPSTPSKHFGNGQKPVGNSTGRRSAPSSFKERLPILPPQDSARLRDAMLADIEALSPQAATRWAGQMLVSKNRLMTDDARAVEQAFEARFATLDEDLLEVPLLVAPEARPIGPVCRSDRPGPDATEHSSANASEHATNAEFGETTHSTHPRPLRTIGKTVRHRNKEHLRFLRTQPCLVCGRQPSDPHHLRFAQPQAMGRKVSDEFTVPLCRTHHREAHRASREIAWWQSHGIAPLAAAEALWRKSQSGQAISELETQPGQPTKQQRSRKAAAVPSQPLTPLIRRG
jgi:hypothetical protein